jgi:hypothetical protein
MALDARRRLLVLVAVCAGSMLMPSADASHGQPQRPGPLDTLTPGAADLRVLDRLRGTWDVVMTMRSPKPITMKYVETFEWVLDRKFLRGETSHKPDGTTDLYMTTYDPRSKHYQFWIFSSPGTFVLLPFGTWDTRTQSMEWKSGPNWEVSFNGRWTFPDANTRESTTLVKDWRGKVLLDADVRAVRRP